VTITPIGSSMMRWDFKQAQLFYRLLTMSQHQLAWVGQGRLNWAMWVCQEVLAHNTEDRIIEQWLAYATFFSAQIERRHR
jgi:hypothetical protein